MLITSIFTTIMTKILNPKIAHFENHKYLNDSEMAAIRQYCDKFRVGTKTVLFREAIMEKVLKELDDSHPTLF